MQPAVKTNRHFGCWPALLIQGDKQIYGTYTFTRIKTNNKIYKIDASLDWHYTLEITDGGRYWFKAA